MEARTALMSPLVDVPAAALAAGFGREVVPLRHNLTGDPLVTRAAVAAASRALPGGCLQRHRADLALVRPVPVPLVDVPFDEILRGINSNDLRIAVYHLEMLPGYAPLAAACVRQVTAAVGEPEGRVAQMEANLFLGSPGSVVPLHYDRHHNVLLQLEGVKEVGVGHFADRSAQRRAIEKQYEDGPPNPDREPDVMTTYRLEPGDGLYIPANALHWVKGGDDVQLAFSCGFSTETTTRDELVQRCNAKLRRLGLRPRPPGASLRIDRTKAKVVSVVRRLRHRDREGV